MKLQIFKRPSGYHTMIDGKEVFVTSVDFPNQQIIRTTAGDGMHETSDQGWVYILDMKLLTNGN